MELFTNREIAVIFWTSAGALWVSSQAAFRSFFIASAKHVFSKRLAPVFATTAAYIGLLVYGLSALGVWNWSHLKATLFWAVFVGIVELFRMPTRAGEFVRFRQLFIDQLKVLVIVEFLVGYTSFPLLIEMMLVPALFFLMLMQSVAEGKEELRTPYNVLTTTLAFVVIVYLGFAVRQVVGNFNEFATIATFVDFALPGVLTILFLPYLFLLSLYSIYESDFSVLRIAIKDDGVRRFAQLTAILTFGANVELLHRWRRDVMIGKPKSKDDVRRITREVLRRRRNENTRRYYAPGEGWDPYVAKGFLAELGVKTDDYHCFHETPNEWCASATIGEPGEGYTGNYFSYYVDGEEYVANVLKFNVSVFDEQDVDETMKKYLAFANMLTEKALGCPLSNALIESIVKRRNHTEELAGHIVAIDVYEYIKSVGGFEVKLTISAKTPELAVTSE
ncbi:hypothetical protein [Hyphococcus luteus]|uniref:Uncharacterized protein n=1 Tax=Hyphococcus luteus TaxID=2058213 RepID=A0A2S7K4X6_9PROT|nr:hypothetical protein [Marinicaulis flavus]PQA87563.1 hypothetical protein CW354_10785 [Marinicaulis flavus]